MEKIKTIKKSEAQVKFMVKVFLLTGLNYLENMIYNLIDHDKFVNIKNQNANFGVYDQIELNLYEKLLDIKSNYDDYTPISNNIVILSRIENDIYKFIDNFNIEFN